MFIFEISIIALITNKKRIANPYIQINYKVSISTGFTGQGGRACNRVCADQHGIGRCEC
jgi:hypothetical protein